MNSGRAKQARRETETLRRNITGTTEKLNRLLCAALSNTDLRWSLGENAEINFRLVIELLLMRLKRSCGTMESLQARRAEGCERNNDENAHHSSNCPSGLDSLAHIRSIRFIVFGRKSLYPSGSGCGPLCCAAIS